MTDDFAYYISAQSTFRLEPQELFAHCLTALREYIQAGGRIPEFVDLEPHALDFPEWLVDHQILHHFEWVNHNTERSSGSLFVIHVYEPNDALLIRMHTNFKPMPPDWRMIWNQHGFDACRMSLLP